MQMKLCISSSEGCLAGLDFHTMFPKNEDKIVSLPLGPNHSKNAQLAIYVGEDSGLYDVPNTQVRHA
jgi:hypothetical protein